MFGLILIVRQRKFVMRYDSSARPNRNTQTNIHTHRGIQTRKPSMCACLYWEATGIGSFTLLYVLHCVISMCLNCPIIITFEPVDVFQINPGKIYISFVACFPFLRKKPGLMRSPRPECIPFKFLTNWPIFTKFGMNVMLLGSSSVSWS